MFKNVVIILGGNEGDRLGLLNKAVKMISDHGEVICVSSIYQSESWGGVADQDFLNQILIVKTTSTPMAFLAQMQSIELALGRKRDTHWGNRTMDIDILYWEEEVIHLPELKVPHPLLDQRRFVLEPLVEILPDFIHPLLKKDQRSLLSACKDSSSVSIFLAK
ncbi:MAG: 2-amino-4-hydroxy-6-hydroxymethyldihydropteridine diphosphokinase [Bacteroidota bacterium]